MKRLFIILAAAISFISVTAQVKVGVVNVQEIYAMMPEVKDARDHFQKVSSQYKAELESMRAEMQKKYAQYQSVNNVGDVPDEIRKRRINELQEIDTKIQRFMATTETALEEISAQLFDPIRTRVSNAINAVGAEGNYTIIYGNLSFNPVKNEASSVLEPVYIGSEVIDVTNLVKEYLATHE